ncbi:hypothetical protein AB6A40_004507 [Gnathostoma spinigerum]|uniref:5'-nucleotidase n=1 Tax=Gnathostoma spinigerum TaxID=75299 RepID=A0ABD6ECP5_9BILA
MDVLLCNKNVMMRNPVLVREKLEVIRKGGNEKLIVISDFDYTLSRVHDLSNNECITTYGVFDAALIEKAPIIYQKLEELKAKFIPIEFDPNIPTEEKIPHMEEWWESAHEQILRASLTREDIEKSVMNAKLEFRDGVVDMIKNLEYLQIPLIVFSAGIGDVIEVFLRNQLRTVPQNVRIVSNMMTYDENGVISGFSDPLIHTFSKNGSVIVNNSSFYCDVAKRTNRLLLGDSLGDVAMDEGLNNDGISLKIGFLNPLRSELSVDGRLEKYLGEYDIVIRFDQTVTVPHLLLKLFTQGCYESDIQKSKGSIVRSLDCNYTSSVEKDDNEEEACSQRLVDGVQVRNKISSNRKKCISEN